MKFLYITIPEGITPKSEDNNVNITASCLALIAAKDIEVGKKLNQELCRCGVHIQVHDEQS